MPTDLRCSLGQSEKVFVLMIQQGCGTKLLVPWTVRKKGLRVKSLIRMLQCKLMFMNLNRQHYEWV